MKLRTIASLLVAASVAGIHSRALAQAEAPLTPPEPPPKWESSAFAGLTLTSGNSETVLFTANFKTQKKEKKNEWAFGLDGAYGENDSERNTAIAHAVGQYNRLFTDRWFGYMRVDALHDDIADVSYRVTAGPGIGYYVIKKKETTLAVEAGPGVVFERVGGTDDTYMTVRIAERFEHKFGDRARIWQLLEFLPQVDEFENHIINAEIGVEASLTKKTLLSVVLQDTYDSQPAPGRKHNDLKLVSGITYKF